MLPGATPLMLVGYPQLLAGASGADPLRLVGTPDYTVVGVKRPDGPVKGTGQGVNENQ